MRKASIIISVLLILGHIQLEFASWHYKIWQKASLTYIWPFIDKDYKHIDEKGIFLGWWIKYVTDDILLITTYCILAYISNQVSQRLFYIACIFVGYHVFDHFMLWYNYKSSHWIYNVELSCEIISVLILFMVKEHKMAKIKSLI